MADQPSNQYMPDVTGTFGPADIPPPAPFGKALQGGYGGSRTQRAAAIGQVLIGLRNGFMQSQMNKYAELEKSYRTANAHWTAIEREMQDPMVQQDPTQMAALESAKEQAFATMTEAYNNLENFTVSGKGSKGSKGKAAGQGNGTTAPATGGQPQESELEKIAKAMKQILLPEYKTQQFPTIQPPGAPQARPNVTALPPTSIPSGTAAPPAVLPPGVTPFM